MSKRTNPFPVPVPQDMLCFTVRDPKSKHTYLIARPDGSGGRLVDPGFTPVCFDRAAVKGFWANGRGTTILLHRKLHLLRHPVAWRDDEIRQMICNLRDTDCLPCPTGPKGERLVDVDTLEHDVSLDVIESLDVVARAIRDAAQL